jgi:hypothetical protein
MKKYIFILLAFLISFTLIADETEKEAKSTIKSVTVFKRGAQVMREAKVEIPAGSSIIKFIGVTPHLDKNSIQVKADGDFTILSVSHQLNFFEPTDKSEEIVKLELELEKLQDQIDVENAILKSFEEEESLILTNKSIGGQQNGVKIEELKATAAFYRERIVEIKLKSLEINNIIKKIKESKEKTSKQLSELYDRKGTYTSEILVAVNSKSATTGRFLLSYIVNNAGWVPHYDIRVKDVQNPVNLFYKANVYQTSGEDWDNINLTLSTGDPSLSGTKPTLYPWRLDFEKPYYAGNNYGRKHRPGIYYGSTSGNGRRVEGIVMDETGEVLIGANVMVKGTTIGTVTNLDGYYSIELPEYSNEIVVSYIGYSNVELNVQNSNKIDIVLEDGAQLLESVVVTSGYSGKKRRNNKDKKAKKLEATKPVPVQQVENATSVEFKIEIPYSIPTSGKQFTVDIKEHSLPAYYEYYCAPKLDKDAFLTAQVTGWDELNLLNGEANLFFEGTYLGKSLLNVQNVEDTLDISLGRDKNIVVTRTKLKEFSKKKFLSNKKVDSRAWDIEVRNKKKETINIVIEDQFPIPSNNEIEVEREEYVGAELDEETGILKWKFELESSASQKASFRYSVKYPNKKIVRLD